MIIRGLFACAAMTASSAALCQAVARPAPAPVAPAAPVVLTTPVAPTASPIAAPSSSNAVLRVGTPVALRLSEELTTKGKKLRVGQRFRMEVAEDVMIQGYKVIPAGSPAVGEITDVRNKGMWGKSGHLAARMLYTTVNGRQIRLSGAFDDKGVAGGVGAVAVSALVFLPAGFFMTGTSALVPMGSMLKGFVDEDVQLAVAAVAPAPLAVTAPAPAAPVSAPAPATAAAPNSQK